MSDEPTGTVMELFKETEDGKLLAIQFGQENSCYEGVIIANSSNDQLETFHGEAVRYETGYTEYPVGIVDPHDNEIKIVVGKVRVETRYLIRLSSYNRSPKAFGVVTWGDVPQFMAAKIANKWYKVHPIESEEQE